MPALYRAVFRISTESGQETSKLSYEQNNVASTIRPVLPDSGMRGNKGCAVDGRE